MINSNLKSAMILVVIFLSPLVLLRFATSMNKQSDLISINSSKRTALVLVAQELGAQTRPGANLKIEAKDGTPIEGQVMSIDDWFNRKMIKVKLTAKTIHRIREHKKKKTM